MITAHLPAGFVTGRLLSREPRVVMAAVVAGVLPDFDLIWFYFIDDRAFHHHRYWVHIPAFWLVVAGITLPLIHRFARAWHFAAVAFFTSLAVHICLDSLTGGILWLWPFSDQLFLLIEVPPTRSHFLLSFLTHWTMVFEAAIWLVAGTIAWRDINRMRHSSTA